MNVDVIVVGGGLAGSALATSLARQGRQILVIEREMKFKDRVRGENILPWGVAMARRLGVLDDLVTAVAIGLHSSTSLRWARRPSTARSRTRRRRAKPAPTCAIRICKRRCSPARRRQART